MRHKLFTLLLALIAGAGTIFAEKVTIGGITYNLTSSSLTAEVSYPGSSPNSSSESWYNGEIIIPSSVTYKEKTYSVTTIGLYAFKNCDLTSVEIPNSVTNIKSEAFYYCSNLTSLKIPGSVTSIDQSAFKNCIHLASVEILNSVTSIGYQTFSGCTSLTSVALGNNVTGIDRRAFEKCTSLTSIEIPNSVTSIGTGAFDGCSSLKSVTLPNSITSIDDETFQDCTALTSIDIPDNVTKIGKYAFDGCSGLISATIGNGVTSIGEYSFQDCTSLSSVTIGSSVTGIRGYAFKRCSALTSIIIPDGVTSIGGCAFEYCSGLTSITIPNSVTSIESSTFRDCTGLTSATIGNGVKSIGDYAFCRCTHLSSVAFGYSITSIGLQAFSSCSQLSLVTCKASTPPTCGNAAGSCFDKDYKFTLKVPAESIDAYQNVKRWAEAAEDILPYGANITIKLSADVPEGYYEDMTVEFKNLRSQSAQSRKVLNKREILFDYQLPGDTYQATLKNAYGQVMGQSEEAKVGEEDFTLTIDNLLQKKDVSLKVNTPDKTDVTDKVTIIWKDGSDKAIGYGSHLKGVAEAAALTCKVTLRDELARQYVAPDAIQFTVEGEGDNVLTLSLQPVQQLTLHGLVKDTETGEAIEAAIVSLTQQQGGSFQSATATTDEDGKYELQGTNEQGELSVTATGYLPKTIDFDAPASEGTLPTVELKPFNGAIVNTWLTYTEAVAEGAKDSIIEGYDGYRDIAWQVHNNTTDAAVEDFIIKDGRLYFPSGVAIGDELMVTASSHSNNFSPVSASCEIGNSGLGFVTLPLVQRGALEATVSSAVSNSVMGVLYDADGRFVRSNIYSSGSLNFARLAAGDYTLISMTSNMLLRRVLLLSTLTDMGLVEGADYVKNAVHIQNGRIAAVSVANVPELDQEKLRFTNAGTYFIANKNIVNAGEYITVSLQVELEEQYVDRIDNVELVVDLPEEIDLLENSVIQNPNTGNYRIEDGHCIFPAGNFSMLKFIVRASALGEFQVTGSVQFTLDGAKTVQPIGTVWVQANGFTMKTPVFADATTLRVGGSAPTLYKGNKIEIFDYDKQIGSAIVKSDGRWSADLRMPSNGIDVHAIKARLNNPGVGAIESDVKYVLYNDNKKTASKVVMLDHRKKPVTFNYLNNTVSPASYTYILKKWWHEKVPYTTDFTFLAFFDDLDITESDRVMIAVLASDGTTRNLNAEYDATKQCYYASSNYPSSSKIPISAYAYIKSDFVPISEAEDAVLTEVKENAEAKVNQVAVKAAETKGEIDILPDDEETLNFNYTVSGKEPLRFSMTEMDYDDAVEYIMENEPLIYHGDAGTIVYSLINGVDDAEMILIDADEHLALRTIITYAETDDPGAPVSQRIAEAKKARPKITFAGAANFGSKTLAVLGLLDYLQAPEQNMEMLNRRERFQKNMDLEKQFIQRLLKQKCPSGKPRFYAQEKEAYLRMMRVHTDDGNRLIKRLSDYHQAYINDLYRKALWDLGTTALGGGLTKGLATGAAKVLGPKALATLGKAKTLMETNKWKNSAAGFGFAKDLGKTGYLGNVSFDQLLSLDFQRHYKNFKDNVDTEGKRVINRLEDLGLEIMKDDHNCKEDDPGDDGDDDEDYDFTDDDDDDYDFTKEDPYPDPVKPLIDPSGYVYEAVPSNRVKGATAVIYYKDNTSESTAVLWDAENYDQVNPQITGADGMYQWDVPQGLWQVRVSKDGYENNQTDWLPVPPPQLDVNIPIIRNRLPQVERAHAYEEAVAVKFDSYMLPEYLNTDQITVTENGAAVAGTIELTDEEEAPDGATFASQLRFIPTNPFTATEVTLNISGLVQSYSGIEMDVPFEAVLPIERELKKLVADEKVKVEYESTGVIRLKGEPVAAAAGKTVKVQCASGIIASTTQAAVVLNEDGEADVTINGDLPGTDYVTFTMEDGELTASTTVKVVLNLAVHVDAPEASVPTESDVERGTPVTLSCPTEGAVIYYTLDGSNPLSSDTRVLYDGTPIVINAETTLSAVAVVEGKGESEVVVFHYTVKVGTQIANLAGSEGKVTPVRVHDSFEVTGVEGTFSVSVYSMSGKLLMKIEQMHSGRRVNASALQPGIHLVMVNGENAYFTQRIIKD